MTECERIISTGVLPSDFLKEEIICDFLVTEKRKKIWAVELDLLFEFDRICRKYDLNYFLSFGALLGAIRHRGVIPWDDDLDVCMKREDYNRFLEIGRKELKHPYFMQIPGEDPGYFFSHAMIRNSNTTGTAWGFCYQPFNHGIWLDIFPMDNCLPEKADENWERVNYLVMTNSTNMRRSLPYPTERDLERMRLYPERDGKEVLAELHNIATQYNNQETEYGVVSTITAYKANRQTYLWRDVLDTVDYEIYGHKIKIPRNYDTILKITYGDYMQLPPKEQRGTWHAYAIFEPDVPYKECLDTIHRNQESEQKSERKHVPTKGEKGNTDIVE